ncbi:ParB N-terminal domain-containing protein [Persicobacter diffluens]|uniref:ParB-like N-terminal domain-containing protein n=1 Tax=Persicobacter diffluens TaxID=981 RepID=A0AAN5AN23_9BACT|nr:hypothetical protein PEDI_56160 [Persicobacter diffluens]
MARRTIDFKGSQQEIQKRKQTARVIAGIDTEITLDILPELDLLIPRPNQEEIELLEESILKEGLREPISVWKHEGKQIIVDGHNRYAILKRNNLPIEINIIHFEDIESVKDWMIDTQLGRRNLTDEKRAYLIGMKYEREKLPRGRKGKLDSEKRKNFPLLKENPANTSSKEIGKQNNLSDRTIRNHAVFYRGVNLLSKQMKDDLLEGNIKISKGNLKTIAQHASQIRTPIENLQEVKSIVDRFTISGKTNQPAVPEVHQLQEELLQKVKQIYQKSASMPDFDRNQILETLGSWVKLEQEKLSK